MLAEEWVYHPGMFGRRVSVKNVLMFSIIAAVVCGLAAAYFASQQSWIATGILGVLALWFAVDAVRSYGWQKKE
jgi:uncharacterized membrane protein YdbT with pleckstrin-like domain